MNMLSIFMQVLTKRYWDAVQWFIVLLLGGTLLIPQAAVAQGFDPGGKRRPDFPIRAFFNKFSINLEAGYGRAFYRHSLENYAYLRNNEGSYIIPNNTFAQDTTLFGYSNWFTGLTPADVNVGESKDSEVNGYKLIRSAAQTSDSAAIPMKSGGYHIPVQLSVYYNLFRFRLGGGVGLNFYGGDLPEPDNFLSAYPEPDNFSSLMTSYYFLLGYSIYEYYDNAFGVDVRVGQWNMGNGFDQSVMNRSNYINIGITLEKVISEYFRMYLRPAYEIKSFSVNLPETSIHHQANSLNLTFGLSINYPDIPRSPIKNDKTQMRHYISDPSGNKKEFRGQPFWRKQDPKIGELYPELIKNKRKRQTKRKNFFKNLFNFRRNQ